MRKRQGSAWPLLRNAAGPGDLLDERAKWIVSSANPCAGRVKAREAPDAVGGTLHLSSSQCCSFYGPFPLRRPSAAKRHERRDSWRRPVGRAGHCGYDGICDVDVRPQRGFFIDLTRGQPRRTARCRLEGRWRQVTGQGAAEVNGLARYGGSRRTTGDQPVLGIRFRDTVAQMSKPGAPCDQSPQCPKPRTVVDCVSWRRS